MVPTLMRAQCHFVILSVHTPSHLVLARGQRWTVFTGSEGVFDAPISCCCCSLDAGSRWDGAAVASFLGGPPWSFPDWSGWRWYHACHTRAACVMPFCDIVCANAELLGFGQRTALDRFHWFCRCVKNANILCCCCSLAASSRWDGALIAQFLRRSSMVVSRLAWLEMVSCMSYT